jgi:hypothetical protein
MKRTKYFIISILTAVITFLLFGFITAVVPNPFFTRMTQLSYFDYLFLTLSSLLLGIYVGLHFYEKNKIKICNIKSDYTAAGGTLLSFLAFSCPVCNILLVYLFGTTALLVYFQPVQPILGTLGIIIIAITIYFKVKKLRKMKY